MFGLKLSVRGHQHVFQLEIPELQAFHGKIELGPEIIIMALLLYIQEPGRPQKTCYLQEPKDLFSVVKAKLWILLLGLSINFLKC